MENSLWKIYCPNIDIMLTKPAGWKKALTFMLSLDAMLNLKPDQSTAFDPAIKMKAKNKNVNWYNL